MVFSSRCVGEFYMFALAKVSAITYVTESFPEAAPGVDRDNAP
jgi:hypothetical protein